MVKRFAAMDVESSGLQPHGGDTLLQVAAYVTDLQYEVLDDAGIEIVFRFSEEDVARMRSEAAPIVAEMHDRTGLWGRLSSSEAVTFEEGDRLLSQYLKQFQEDGDEMYLLGNSITLDRGFMEVFLPETFKVLHYRSLDVTSVRIFLESKMGSSKSYYKPMENSSHHDARSDILNSLNQIRFYDSLLP